MKLNHFSGIMLGAIAFVVFAGCGPSAQDLYNEAVRQVAVQQENLDRLRAGYDAARQKAILAVTKELAGATPDENAQNALKQLEGLSGSVGGTDLLAGSNLDQIDAAVDHLTKMQSAIESQQDILLGGVVKINETMKNIETPGTPENKHFEEVLNTMPEVQAYRRQEKRLEEAQKTLLEADKTLDASKK
jgi:hypothetical protein